MADSQSLDLVPGRRRDTETWRPETGIGPRTRATWLRATLPAWPRRRIDLERCAGPARPQVINLAAFGGLAMESMTRGQGWRFLDMGRRLERSLHTLILLRTDAGDGERHGGTAPGSPAGDRRQLDDLSPPLPEQPAGRPRARPAAGRRSQSRGRWRFSWPPWPSTSINLPQDNAHPRRSPEQRIMLAALTALRLADIDALARRNDARPARTWTDLLRRLEAELPVLSDTHHAAIT